MSASRFDVSPCDDIAEEQSLFVWSIPYEGNGIEVAGALREAVVGAFVKLRGEKFERSFTVFVGDHVGLDVYVGLQKKDYRFSPIRDWLTKFIAGRFLSVGPEWRSFSSPRDGFAAPLFRYTPTFVKDYEAEDDDQVGNTHNKYGLEMTYFRWLPTFGGPESYTDSAGSR